MIGVAPILPSRDLSATAAFYERLHFVCEPGVDPYSTASACYLYGLREFAVVDPDGNLLRIGSFVAEQR